MNDLKRDHRDESIEELKEATSVLNHSSPFLSSFASLHGSCAVSVQVSFNLWLIFSGPCSLWALRIDYESRSP